MRGNFMRSPNAEPIQIRDRVKDCAEFALGATSQSSELENSWPGASRGAARATRRDRVRRCTPRARVCGELLILAEQSDGVETC